jgi:hypothetical protein
MKLSVIAGRPSGAVAIPALNGLGVEIASLHLQ